MKKCLSLMLALLLVFSMTACRSSTQDSVDGNESASSVQATENETETTEELEETEETDNETAESEPKDMEISEAETEQSRSLVVYFSATGNTQAVAEELAAQTGADLYEIVPEEPYTDDDLNYSDRTTRATVEQNDPDARPAISGSIPNLDQYDTIYIGYPIWWGDMPRILYTFFDACDFSGKTVAPFCTSGSSGISGTVDTIEGLEPDALVTVGLSVKGADAFDAVNDISQWLDEIGLAQ